MCTVNVVPTPSSLSTSIVPPQDALGGALERGAQHRAALLDLTLPRFELGVGALLEVMIQALHLSA